MINVKLLTHTPEPEKVIAMAAKLCYSSSDIETLEESLTEDKIQSFLDMLMGIGRESPVEHVCFTFAIEGISRAASHQLVRHRIASYSQKSQRYVDETNPCYITPPVIESDETMKTKYDDTIQKIYQAYDELRHDLTKIHTERIMAENGLSYEAAYKKAVKLANEDARFILPNATETKIIVTMNIRSLFNFFKLRMCNRAQWEIRDVAWKMYALCMEVSPTLFNHAGPGCLHHICSEGTMSCGKMNEVKNKKKEILDSIN